MEQASLWIGTSGWSYPSWVGPFYPPGMAPKDFLRAYADHFRAVEVDSSFYRLPARRMVELWATATPAGFLLCPKVPRVITHDKRLQGCEREIEQTLETLGGLGDKLGPLIFQFEYTFEGSALGTLARFLPALPRGFRYAMEVRHRSWLHAAFYDLLRELGVALVLHDLHYMPKLRVATADFVVLRLIGRRQDIPGDDFSRIRFDRDPQLRFWAGVIREHLQHGRRVFAFANNHYQGHAPATARRLQDFISEPGRPEP